MKRWATPLKLFVSVVLLGFLFFSIDRSELVATFSRVDPVYLIISILLSFAMVAVSTWKWHYLLHCQENPLPFGRLYRWYFIGYFYSSFIPSNIGGDVARAWLAGKATGSTSAAAASIFAERFTGMVFLLVMAVLSPWLVPSLAVHVYVWPGVVAGLFGLMAIMAAFSIAKKRSLPSGKWMSKIDVFANKLGQLLTIIRGDKSIFWAVTGLTALFYLLMLVNVALAFRAFGEWPDMARIAAVFPVALMVAMIPLTLGNLGIAEGAYVFYFGLAGMGGELSLAMGLLLRLKIYMLAVIGMFIQMREPLGKPEKSPVIAT